MASLLRVMPTLFGYNISFITCRLRVRQGLYYLNGSLSSNTSGEGEIRKALVVQDLVDCIVMLPTQLFYNTGIPACLWFLSRYKNGNKHRDRKGEVLFIDASELGYMVNRSSRAFTEEEIKRVAHTYHEWKRKPSPSPSQREEKIYSDIKGFCKSASLAEIEKHNFVLTPGLYVGIPDEVEDDVSFDDRMGALTMALGEQMREGRLLDEEIKKQLGKVGFIVSDRLVD